VAQSAAEAQVSARSTSETAASEGLWSASHRTLTLGLVLTITLVAFEALAIVTIMPIVAAELHGIELYGWVFSAFFLGSLLGIVFVGGLIDRGGLVRPFVVGLGLFSIGLIGGGLAPSMGVLVGARFIQGLGAGAIPPIAYVSIGRALPESLRPRMFATLSTAWVLPGVIGPAISGAVAEHLHWRLVFLGLLPLIAVAGVMTLPAIRRLGATTANEEAYDDRGAAATTRALLGPSLLVSAGAGLVLAGLTSGALIPGVPLVVAGLAAGVPAFRRLTPEGTLVARPGMPAAILLRGLLTFMFFCADAFVPLALQDWRGVSPTVSGIAVTTATLSWTGGSWIQAHFIPRFGARRFVTAGFITTGLGILAFASVLSPQVPIIVGIVAWGIAGLGMGLSYSTTSLVVLAEAPAKQQGRATSGLQLSDVLGTTLGTGVGGAIIAFGHGAGWEGWVGLAGAFAVGVIAAAAGTVLARRLPKGRVRAVREPRAGEARGDEPTAATS
jgi:MFS family permease